MSQKTYPVWTCPVCGTNISKNGSRIRNPLSRYNHLKWHEKVNPDTVRRVTRSGEGVNGYIVLKRLDLPEVKE